MDAAPAPAEGQHTAPQLTLDSGDVPGALRVLSYLTQTYDYTRRDDTEPSQFERTILAVSQDIVAALKHERENR